VQALAPHGPDLLRAVCILSMAPRLLLSPSTIKVRLTVPAQIVRLGSVFFRT
jgi:hypothetical protein